ncbi:MAG: LTA synthase family protein [Gammaproteobacteria bacterium]|nr:LTA synthase family protein [Gammaproteobacteria bacterium]MDH4316509.1 LTA synthase family protein [Gammaproteobacteria bacterium]MDH5215490.1 LTA synthase family protein [Gammaproteobacteria bacterium]
MNTIGTARGLMRNRLAGVAFIFLPILLSGLVLRIALATTVWQELGGFISLLAALAVGLFHDLVFASYLAIPAVLYLALVPQRLFASKAQRIASWIFFACVWWFVFFQAAAEWIFWDEFGVRFNFIAVDYLVYTTEVIDNILQSYPVGRIVASIAAIALIANGFCCRTAIYKAWLNSDSRFLQRRGIAIAMLSVPVLATAFVSQSGMPHFDNRYEQELAKNGQYSFFAAFRNNDLPYRDFYDTAPGEEAMSRLRMMVSERRSLFLGSGGNPVRRKITSAKETIRPNVIQITVESLNADFMSRFGNTQGLTPRLDELAKESLVFNNFMATGTRTVRGMEALTLSVPPTPGRSIVKRPDNTNLFTIGTVFRANGYKTSFIYGGRGYFDNMNAFFGGNGFEIHDQASEPDEGVEFTNAWGVSDEDLYKWVLAEADKSAAAGEPFYQFVMTTSNHRPYTFPEGRIDMPSHSGRAAAIKYTDYAIGKLLDEARSKPWFDNTIFVIVGDHCASSAGKTDVPVNNYHVPLLVYAPGIIAPHEIDTLSSQIDYAPTLFELMGWSYVSEFYGKDILAMRPEEGRALVGTYQSLGLYRNNKLTLLKPLHVAESYVYDPSTKTQARSKLDANEYLDAIAYYQSAADGVATEPGALVSWATAGSAR